MLQTDVGSHGTDVSVARRHWDKFPGPQAYKIETER